ncbi:MAG: heavy metal translocating P-type ATPase, partial [Bacilli bacterium]
MKKEYILNGYSSIETLDKIEQQLYNFNKDLKFSLDKTSSTLKFEYGNDEADIVYHVEEILEANEVLFIERNIKPTVRKVFILEGLDCANCASKIERIAKRTIDHKFIVVDFATTRFIIETEDVDNAGNLINKVQEIASSVDNGVKVRTNQDHKKNEQESIKISKWDKLSFIIGSALFLFGVAVRYSLLGIWNIEIPGLIIIGFYLIAYTLLGFDVIVGAFKNIVNGRFFDEKFLMTLATLVALGIGFYEEAVSVMIFYKVGELLQENAVNKSRRNIASLIEIQPTVARIVVDGEILEVDPLEVVVGDVILVKAGERIPLDGVVISGEAALDVSALTGENKYLEVYEGNPVVSGAINTNGVLKIKVEKVYNDSTVSQILQMVENASSLKAKTENLVTKLARYYTPTVVILALIWSLSPFVLKTSPVWSDFQSSIYAAMIFLVASCPCALVIS